MENKFVINPAKPIAQQNQETEAQILQYIQDEAAINRDRKRLEIVNDQRRVRNAEKARRRAKNRSAAKTKAKNRR